MNAVPPDEPLTPEQEALLAMHERLHRAQHAMQSGVAMDQAHFPDNAKHMRVGVNSAMVEGAAVAGLLIKKGIFTELEYYTALAEGMEAEQQRYERLLTARMGCPVTLA